MTPAATEGLVGEFPRDVVVEDCELAGVFELRGFPTSVDEHLLSRFTGRRDHRGDENDQSGTDPLGHDRGDVPAERLGDDDHVVSITDRIDDRRRVLRETGLVVLDRKVRRDGVVATEPELGLDEMPVPANVAGTMDECEVRHISPDSGTRTLDRNPSP